MSYSVGGVAVLTGTFKVGDVLTSPTTVVLNLRTPAGVVTDVTPAEESEGVFTYDLTLTEAGRWTWEFVGTGDAAGVQVGALTANPSLSVGLDARAVATVAEVEERLHKTLTDAEAADAEGLIAQLVDVLELRLNRYLFPREVTETHYMRADGTRLVLFRGPVREILEILVDGVALPAGHVALTDWENPLVTWLLGVPIEVTYRAGDDIRPAVTGGIVDVVARTIQAGVAAGSGAIKSYSVEGTSITYGDVADGGTGGSGRLKVGDIRAIGRLRRPVLLI